MNCKIKWECDNEFKIYDGSIDNSGFKLSIENNDDGKFLAMICSDDYFVLDYQTFDTLEEAKEYIQNYIKERVNLFLERGYKSNV